jgi:tripartite-type tricarboxylate transporter receptor subunit TctC
MRAGTLRTLAVTSNTRSVGSPGIPTVEQAAGIANYDVRSWFALAAPAATPKPIVERLNAELRKALAVPEVRARLDALGGDVAATTPQEMHDRVARELAVWTTTVNEAGIPKQ